MRSQRSISESQYDEALTAAEKALKLAPEDIHIHTSLSRIWMERGDKKAEHHGAQARMLGWKEQLRSPEEDKDSFSGIDSTESTRLDSPQ